MSKHGSSSEQPIPVVILLSDSGSTRKANHARSKRQSASSAQQLPWLWIASGGGAAWVTAVLVIAYVSMTREPEQPAKPNAQALARLGAVEPAFRVPPPVEQPEAVAPQIPAIEAIDEAPAFHDAPAPGAAANFRADHRRFADCQQIGTNVQFMRDPPEAFQRAKAERKMVFMVHLSGNLEDKEFT